MRKFCLNCGLDMPPETTVCPMCGVSLAGEDSDFVDRLIAALRHPVPDRAGLAINILADMLHEPRAILPLIHLLSTSNDAEILRQAVQALGHFGDPRAVEPLLALASRLETALIVRRAVVDALACIGGDGAESGLWAALEDPSASVRELAQAKLAELKRSL